MLIFLYGPDTFRLRQKLVQIVAEYKKRSPGTDFLNFDAGEDRFEDFFSSLRQGSLFSGRKFLAVKNPINDKNFKESLIENIDAIAASGHNVVFSQESKVLKADRLLKALAGRGQIQEFAPLEGAKLNDWIARRFGELGKSVDAKIAQSLAGRLGGDLWRLENEIQKIAHYAARAEIGAADIETADFDLAAEIFKTMDAVAARDKKNGLRLVKEHCAKGDHPIYLLAMLAGQFRNLLLAKESGGAGGPARLGMHPFVFSKAMAMARRFSEKDLKDIYRRLAVADFDVKTGKIDAFAGLDLLIARL